MKSWNAFVTVLALVLTACGGKPLPSPAATTSSSAPRFVFGVPSVAHLSAGARSEALVAFELAQRFITTGGVDIATLDLSRPSIHHFCPPQEVVYDWCVVFPKAMPHSGPNQAVSLAVRNNGTCWVVK